MSAETEIERLVVRLVGDNSSYKRMLADTIDATKAADKAVEAEVARLASGGDMTNIGILLMQQDQMLGKRERSLGKSAEALAREEIATLGATEGELKMMDALVAQEKVVHRQEEAFSRKEMYVRRATGATSQYAEQVDDLRILLDKGGLTQDQYNANIKALYSEHLVQTAQGFADVSGKVALFTGLLSFGAAGIRDAGIKSAAAYEETEVAFGTMMGSAEKAKSFLEELTAFAVRTPFEMPELENVSRQLIMFGETQQSVMETTEMLGNVAAGVGRQHFNMLGIIYNQIRGVGHLLTGDFRQMATRGAVSLQDIAKYYKVADSAAMSMISHGKVSFEDFRNIIMSTTQGTGRFAGMMEKQSGTMGGLMSTYSDAQGIAMRKIAENFLPAEKAFLKFKIFFMDTVANMNKPTAALVSTLVGVGAAAVSVTAGISGTIYIGSQAVTIYKSITTQMEALAKTSHLASAALGGLTIAKYASVAAGAALGIATAAIIGYNLGKMWYEASEGAQQYNKALEAIKEQMAGLPKIDIKRMGLGRLDEETEIIKKQLAAQEAILASAKAEGKDTAPFEKVVQGMKDQLKALEDARVLRAPELPIEETEIRAKKAEDEYARVQQRLTTLRTELKQLDPQVEAARSQLKWSLPGEGEQEAKARFTALFARQKQLREEEAKAAGERPGALTSMQGMREALKKAREEAGIEIDPQKVTKAVEGLKEQINAQKLKLQTELMPPKEAELYKLADSLKMKDTTVGLKGLDVKVEEEKLRLYTERKEQLDEEWAKKAEKHETDRANAAHKVAEKYEEQAKNAGKTKYELEGIKLRAERIKDVTGQSEVGKYTEAEISRITGGMKTADQIQSDRAFKDRTDDFIKQAWAVDKTATEMAIYEENLKRAKAGLDSLTPAQEESLRVAMATADLAKARETLDPTLKQRRDVGAQLGLLAGQPDLLQKQLELWAGFKNPIQEAADKSRVFREEMEKAGKAGEWVAVQLKAWSQELDPLTSLKNQVGEINRKFGETGDIRLRDEAFRQMNRSVTDSIDPTAKYADETNKLDYMLKETGLSQKDYDLAMKEARKGLGQLTDAEMEQIQAQTRRMDAIRAGTDGMRQMQQYTLEFLASNTKAGEQMLAGDALNRNRPGQIPGPGDNLMVGVEDRLDRMLTFFENNSTVVKEANIA